MNRVARKMDNLKIGIVAILLFSVFTAISAMPSVQASIIYVPDNYTTIQFAVNAAFPGDTIIVRDGTYIENIKVNKRLTIRSENGPDTTIVRAAERNDHVLEVTANYVNISGFTIEDVSARQLVGYSSVGSFGEGSSGK